MPLVTTETLQWESNGGVQVAIYPRTLSHLRTHVGVRRSWTQRSHLVFPHIPVARLAVERESFPSLVHIHAICFVMPVLVRHVHQWVPSRVVSAGRRRQRGDAWRQGTMPVGVVELSAAMSCPAVSTPAKDRVMKVSAELALPR